MANPVASAISRPFQGASSNARPPKYPSNGDHFSSALFGLVLGPLDALAGLLAPEEPIGNATAEPTADQVGDVVAEKRSNGGCGNDQQQVKVAACGDNTRRDSGGLGGHDRHERVEQGEQEHDGIRPPRRVGHELAELLEHVALPAFRV